MDSVSPQDVYARHLASRRGYPLWTPEPSMSLPDVYRQHGLKIGDVGVVDPEDGSFDVFFNICLSSTHSLHRQTGVPDNFTPVQLEQRDVVIFPEAESAGRIISTSSVARIGGQSSNENTTRVAQPGPLNYEFNLSSKEGALLILPEGAERYCLKNQRSFLEEAIQHAVDWYNFAEDRLGRIISHDSLYLITGFYKACSWSLASYHQASGAGAYAQFKATQVGSGSISRSYTWETTHALDWRVGPSDQFYNGIANQSIFIQGFKIAVRSSILGTKRVKVKADLPVARPHKAVFYSGLTRLNIGARLPSSRSSTLVTNVPRATDADSNTDAPEGSFDRDSNLLDDDEDIAIQYFPQVPNPFHPSDVINQYLLRSHPSAVIAITHDAQWIALLERELLKPEELVQEGRLESLVCDTLPVIQGGVVYLQNITSDDNTESNAPNDETGDTQETGPTIHAKKYETQIEGPETHSGCADQESPRPDAVSTRTREVTNTPVFEVEPYDFYKSKLSRANHSAGPAGGILKKWLSPPSPDLVPDTIEFSKLSLVEERAELPLRGSKNVHTRGKSKQGLSKSIAGQSVMPLKSIPEGGMDAESYHSDESDNPQTKTAKKAARSQYNTPSVSPPRSPLVPVKKPAFGLHWTLVFPYDPRISKGFLRFDIAFPVDEIVLGRRDSRTKLIDRELDKPAANGTITKMLITFKRGPFHWEVDIKNAHGIRCRDVFEAIYKTFNERLTFEEQRLVRDRRAVEEAFRLRCKLASGFPEVERSYGWKRVDVLLHRTIFLGLTQPKSCGDWILNLGSPPYIPDLSEPRDATPRDVSVVDEIAMADDMTMVDEMSVADDMTTVDEMSAVDKMSVVDDMDEVDQLDDVKESGNQSWGSDPDVKTTRVLDCGSFEVPPEVA